jgi:putative heme-binding domain-containing protein
MPAIIGSMVLSAAIGWVAGAAARAQELGHGMTPADVERGGVLFMTSCASCHGADGDLIAGVDLAAGTFRRASNDQELVAIIRGGVPGTPMPPSAINEADATRIVAYLRSLPALRRGPGTAGLRGDAARGRSLFQGKGGCLECHLVGDTGGFLGPDLSSVGLTRRVDELERSLTNPNADIRTGSIVAVAVRRDGTQVTGRVLNQDTYSLQLIDAQGRLMSVDKLAVRSWEIPRGSVMPAYTDRLSPDEIADIVSYMRTLQAPVPVNPGGRRGGGAGAGPGGPAGAPPAGRSGAPR